MSPFWKMNEAKPYHKLWYGFFEPVLDLRLPDFALVEKMNGIGYNNTLYNSVMRRFDK